MRLPSKSKIQVISKGSHVPICFSHFKFHPYVSNWIFLSLILWFYNNFSLVHNFRIRGSLQGLSLAQDGDFPWLLLAVIVQQHWDTCRSEGFFSGHLSPLVQNSPHEFICENTWYYLPVIYFIPQHLCIARDNPSFNEIKIHRRVYNNFEFKIFKVHWITFLWVLELLVFCCFTFFPPIS